MATMNVSLPDTMKQWVEKRADTGRYSNASDYVRDLIRKDQERQEAIDVLQAAVAEGLESGDAQKFDAGDFKLKMRQRHVIG
ncbi:MULTISPECIES: type II toxin-antitoxin system ParD family antitoxin [Thalassospira]|uniref:Addiction module antitoxin n=2 Tax=Thalassospira TaxID=168934 RepID=A0A367W5W2_9PROT|nr:MULTISPECIES: type II toxin-antitoxin system ParD family antitoxin [Thalassospira]MDG4719346.1 type II toxin-antitoxin system ParD family antitoxin [Thalassospira sp. FZY0004]RCK36818.1 hypothetical protein TH19_12980 [Thalassospira profundimaris]